MNTTFKNIIIVFVLGAIVFAIGNALYGQFQFDSFNDLLINFGFYQLYSFVLGLSNMTYFSYLEKLDWKEGERIKRVLI